MNINNGIKTKVLYAITKSNWGGAQRYVFDLATMLPKDRFETAVALGGDGLLAQKLRGAGVPIFRVENLDRDISFLKDFAAFLELLKIFRHERPNVVHLNSSKIGALGALAARLAGVPKIIFTAHGWAFNEDRGALKKIAIKFVSWVTALLCTNVIVLSDKELRDAAALPFAAHKTKRIYLGAEPQPCFTQNEARALLAQKISKPANFFDDKIVVGTISELHRNKGLEFMIAAIAAVSARPDNPSLRGVIDEAISILSLSKDYNNLVFLIIGEGEERKNLEALIAARGLQEKVFLAGFIENASRFLPAFDIFTLTSRKEGLPYVLLEAGLAGLPVIASAVGGIPEIINSPEVGAITQAKDVATIASALEKMANDEPLRKSMGEKLRERIQMQFSREAMLQETEKIYKK